MADNDGWIEWGGGECPVALDSDVDVKLRNGDVVCGEPAGDWAGWDHEETPSSSNWMHDGSEVDIIAYRIVTPHA